VKEGSLGQAPFLGEAFADVALMSLSLPEVPKRLLFFASPYRLKNIKPFLFSSSTFDCTRRSNRSLFLDHLLTIFLTAACPPPRRFSPFSFQLPQRSSFPSKGDRIFLEYRQFGSFSSWPRAAYTATLSSLWPPSAVFPANLGVFRPTLSKHASSERNPVFRANFARFL